MPHFRASKKVLFFRGAERAKRVSVASLLSCVRAFGCEQISYPNLCFENVRKSVQKSVPKSVPKSVDENYFRFVTYDVHRHLLIQCCK